MSQNANVKTRSQAKKRDAESAKTQSKEDQPLPGADAEMEEVKRPDIDQQIPQNQNLGTSLIDENNQQNLMNYSAQQQINSAQQLHTADPTLEQANMTQQKSGISSDLD